MQSLGLMSLKCNIPTSRVQSQCYDGVKNQNEAFRIHCLQEGSELQCNRFFNFFEEWKIRYRPIQFFIFSGSRFGFFKRGFITATFSEFGTHPVDREPFIMFNIGEPSTGSSSFRSLVEIGSSIQLEGLEAKTIFNVSRDIVLKHLSVSLDPRSCRVVQTQDNRALKEYADLKRSP